MLFALEEILVSGDQQNWFDMLVIPGWQSVRVPLLLRLTVKINPVYGKRMTPVKFGLIPKHFLN